MIVSFIVATDENNLIGKNNQLPWHLPADLQYFKKITTGHYIIMGRKTFESIGRPLPNRTTVIITQQPDYKSEGCIVVNSIEEALEASKNEGEVFIIGGAEIFKTALHKADRLYLTRIHHNFDGDVYLPQLNLENWKEVKREDHPPDEKNHYPYSFIILEKKRFNNT
jgi:dihydrofolate reductase